MNVTLAFCQQTVLLWKAACRNPGLWRKACDELRGTPLLGYGVHIYIYVCVCLCAIGKNKVIIYIYIFLCLIMYIQKKTLRLGILIFFCLSAFLVPPLFGFEELFRTYVLLVCSTFVPLLFHFCSTFVPLLFQFCSTFVPLLFQFCSIFPECIHLLSTLVSVLHHASLMSGDALTLHVCETMSCAFYNIYI